VARSRQSSHLCRPMWPRDATLRGCALSVARRAPRGALACWIRSRPSRCASCQSGMALRPVAICPTGPGNAARPQPLGQRAPGSRAVSGRRCCDGPRSPWPRRPRTRAVGGATAPSWWTGRVAPGQRPRHSKSTWAPPGGSALGVGPSGPAPRLMARGARGPHGGCRGALAPARQGPRHRAPSDAAIGRRAPGGARVWRLCPSGPPASAGPPRPRPRAPEPAWGCHAVSAPHGGPVPAGSASVGGRTPWWSGGSPCASPCPPGVAASCAVGLVPCAPLRARTALQGGPGRCAPPDRDGGHHPPGGRGVSRGRVGQPGRSPRASGDHAASPPTAEGARWAPGAARCWPQAGAERLGLGRQPRARRDAGSGAAAAGGPEAPQRCRGPAGAQHRASGGPRAPARGPSPPTEPGRAPRRHTPAQALPAPHATASSST
jgi:hypothetical protein